MAAGPLRRDSYTPPVRRTVAVARRRGGHQLPDSRLYDRAYLLSNALDGIADYEAGGLSVVRRREVELLDVAPGHRALDVGCGRGETAAEIRERGAEVVAIDYSWDAVVLTSERLDGNGSVAQANAVALPFRDRSFDRVLLSDVVEHVPWPMAEQLLREVRRILAPGGRVVVHTAPNLWFISVVKRPLVLLLRLTRRQSALQRFAEYDRLRDLMHPNELSPSTFRRLMRGSGMPSEVWVDADVLRSGSSEWTARWPQWLVRLLGVIAGSWPLRLLLGNDMYAIATPAGSDALTRHAA